MNYLLDTHIILWWLTEPEKIAKKARDIISDRGSSIYISSVSFWEMAIKQSIGRLHFPINMIQLVTQQEFEILPIYANECLATSDLPLHHSDPFDRMLIIQAKLQDLILITRDKKLAEYPVVTIAG